jgi:hypothetical protein
MSQEELAERAGLSVQGLSALENGRRQVPYRHTVTRLARALALSDIEAAALEAAVVRMRAAAPAGMPASRGHSQEISPDGGAGGDASPPARSPRPPRTDLPARCAGFIRREREQGEVRALPQSAPRLVTLTGAGGADRSRLALAVTEAALLEYPDGVWLVQLAPLADAALAVQAVAQAMGLCEEPSRPLLATLVDHLEERQLLPVLDNCEHLVGACAELATALLRACHRLRILATSRETLEVAGEASIR